MSSEFYPQYYNQQGVEIKFPSSGKTVGWMDFICRDNRPYGVDSIQSVGRWEILDEVGKKFLLRESKTFPKEEAIPSDVLDPCAKVFGEFKKKFINESLNRDLTNGYFHPIFIGLALSLFLGGISRYHSYNEYLKKKKLEVLSVSQDPKTGQAS